MAHLHFCNPHSDLKIHLDDCFFFLLRSIFELDYKQTKRRLRYKNYYCICTEGEICAVFNTIYDLLDDNDHLVPIKRTTDWQIL